MSTILTSLGLQAADPLTAPPSLIGTYLIFHFLFAFGVVSSRIPKRIYGLDHQASPREDLGKFGADAVKAGKLTQAQLDQLRRLESAQANSVEHYPVFAAAMIFAHVAGVDAVAVNAAGLVYTVMRVAYAASYTFISGEKASGVRGLFWWGGNVVCLRLFWVAGNVLNARTVI